MRIPVGITTNLTWQSGHEPISAEVRDISWGGALLTVSELLPTEAKSLLIDLPWTPGEYISVEATVMRAEGLPNGQYLTAIRFSSLCPASELRLQKLLAMLRSSGITVDSEEPTNLFHEINLIVSEIDEWRDIMAQIAAGCYTLLSIGAYELDESICLSIEGPDNFPSLRLRARIVAVQNFTGSMSNWQNVRILMLELEHPREALVPLVDHLLGFSRKKSKTSRNVMSSSAGSSGRPVASDTHCAIELDYPELLHDLFREWGDVSAFEVLFQNLTLSDVGQSIAFPMDVWDELIFLQMVHDKAYGLSETKKNLLISAR